MLKIFKPYILVITILIAGCATPIHYVIKRNIYKDIKTSFSASLFFNAASNREIFFQVRNEACGQFTEQIKQELATKFKAKHFSIVTDPVQAKYLVQLNILQCDYNTADLVEHALTNGFGSEIEQNKNPITPRTLDEYENNRVSVIADLQVIERLANSQLSQQNAATKEFWKKYQTRVAVSRKPWAERDFNSSAHWLIDAMTTAIVGIFSK